MAEMWPRYGEVAAQRQREGRLYADEPCGMSAMGLGYISAVPRLHLGCISRLRRRAVRDVDRGQHREEDAQRLLQRYR